MRTQKTKPKAPLLENVYLFCPLSGFKCVDGSVIPPHRMLVRTCANGALMAYCQNHVFRCFATAVETVKTIKAVADAQPKETP